MNLSGKTVLLTGAKRIGKTVAIEIAKKGANLAITYNSSREEAEELKLEIERLGVRVELIQADLSSEEDIKNLVNQTVKSFGGVDVLIHMASPYPKTPIGEISMNDFDGIMRSIAGSAALLGQEVGTKIMSEGKMIFFSDWSVLRNPYEDYLVYNAAKAAIESITKTLARALAPKVAVNAIAPGPILRPPDLTEEEDKQTLERTPLKRWGGAEEIAKAVLFLIDSDFITGVILPVDGGRSVS